MKKILLALDIGNVCVKIDHANFHRKLGISHTPEAVRELFRDFELGHLSGEDDFLKRAVKILDNKFSAEQIKEAFNAIIIEPVPGMEQLAGSFQAKNIQAVFFSDISPTHLQRTKEIFSAFDAVAGGVFSFECGSWKPSDEMFETFERRYGKPDLYVDDRIELIEAAGKRQWHAGVFTGTEDLMEKLQALS